MSPFICSAFPFFHLATNRCSPCTFQRSSSSNFSINPAHSAPVKCVLVILDTVLSSPSAISVSFTKLWRLEWLIFLHGIFERQVALSIQPHFTQSLSSTQELFHNVSGGTFLSSAVISEHNNVAIWWHWGGRLNSLLFHLSRDLNYLRPLQHV